MNEDGRGEPSRIAVSLAAATVSIIASLACNAGLAYANISPTPSQPEPGGCPSGTRPATQADVPIMQEAGIPDAAVGMCWNPNDFNGGETAGKAKQYLMTLLQTSNQCMAPELQIAGLNGSFSICAARFLQAFSQQYGGSTTITRAYFTTQCEASMCAGNDGCGALKNNPSPVSNHTRGLAIDVTASGGTDALARFAQANPQFGVCFPFNEAYTHNAGFTDNVHMILAGIQSSETNGPGCSNVKAPCSGSGYDPNSVAMPAIQTAAAPYNYASPAALGISSAMQNPLLMSQPPFMAANPFPMNPLIAMQPPQICTPQYMCSGATLTYQTSSCTTQAVQTCQYGCSGTACSPAPSSFASTTQQAQSNSISNSILTPAVIATSSILSLGTGLSGSVQENPGPQNTSVITTIVPGDANYVPADQSTFPSSVSVDTVRQQPALSALQQLLENLRTVLLSIFNYLSPSGQ